MVITINFVDDITTSIGKKSIKIDVERPIKIKELFAMAQIQEESPNLKRELEGLMIIYNSKLRNYREAMEILLVPGDKILLIPLLEGG